MKFRDLSVSKQVLLPFFIIIVISFLIISAVSEKEMVKIKKNTLSLMSYDNKIYIDKSLQSLLSFCVAQSTLLSMNTQLIMSLDIKDRDEALDILNKVVKTIRQEFGINEKIHVHTKDLRSFVRQWKPNKYGDYLGGFRHTLVYVKKTKKPLKAIEVGRAGPVIRGISPIFKNGEYIGSVEVIRSLNDLVKGARKSLKADIIVLLSPQYSSEAQLLKLNTKLDGYYVIEKNINSTIKTELNSVQFTKKSYILTRHYFVTPIALKDFQGKKIGYILVVQNKNVADATIMKTKKILYVSMVLMLISIVLIVLSVYVSMSRISKNLKNLIDRVEDLHKGEGDLTKRLNVESNDELGQLASTFNLFLDKIRAMINDTKQTVSQLGTHSSSLSSAANEMASTTQQTTANMQEIETAINDATQAVDGVARSSENVNSLASEVGEVNQQMLKDIEERLNRMEENALLAKEAMEQINTVGESSKQIGQIVGVINEIADQTNLLALNAAIEAARAGEAGRGFAVVADEVRKLAEKTQHATEEIRNMINTIQNDTKAAVDKTEKAGDMILAEKEKAYEDKSHIEEVVGKTNNVIDEINSTSAATEELSSTVAEINMQIREIAEATRENAKAVDDVARSSEELNQIANKVEQLVGRFRT